MVLLWIGVVLLVIAIILFFVRKNQNTRASCLKLARTVTVAELEKMAKDIAQEIGGGSWREHVKVWGTIRCDRPLTSQLKQESCVHYTMSVKREYEETVTRKDSEGKSRQETQRSSEVVSSNEESCPFLLEDKTGKIEVNPDGADIETIKVLDEFRQEKARGGMISYGGFSLALGKQFGQPNRRTLGYHYSESILPIERKALVLATVSDSTGDLVLQKSTDANQKFIISLRTAEELTAAADRNAKNSFYGMVACGMIGVILVLVGLVT